MAKKMTVKKVAKKTAKKKAGRLEVRVSVQVPNACSKLELLAAFRAFAKGIDEKAKVEAI